MRPLALPSEILGKAVTLYRDILGLKVTGNVTITGEESSAVTQVPDTNATLSIYPTMMIQPAPPIELLYFVEPVQDLGKPYPGLTDPRAPFLDLPGSHAEVIAPSHPSFCHSARPVDFDTVYDLAR